MKKTFTGILFTLLIINQSWGQVIFTYKSVQVMKSTESLDTVSLWSNAKAKNTYNLSGSLLHNKTKDYIKIRRSGDDSYEEINYVFKKRSYGYDFINGKRLYLFSDPVYGPSVAVWLNKGGNWLIFRKVSLEQIKKMDAIAMMKKQESIK